MDFLFGRVSSWEQKRVLQTFILISEGGPNSKSVISVTIDEHNFETY